MMRSESVANLAVIGWQPGSRLASSGMRGYGGVRAG